MIRLDTKQAAMAWVAARRRESDAALVKEQLRLAFMLWWIEIVPRIYPGASVMN